MNAVNDAKARLGYRQSGRRCDECLHVKFTGEWSSGDVSKRCGIGGFAVKARATCDKWADHTKPMLAKMEGEK